MDSVQRHLRLFNIRGGLNQVMVAVCFLEGKAREWWDKAYTTRMDKEITDMDQLYKVLQMEFQPMNKDFKVGVTIEIASTKRGLESISTGGVPIERVSTF